MKSVKKQTMLMILALILMAVAWPVRAEVAMPQLFGSAMVLQRAMDVPVWGTADPGETVTVTFAGQSATAQTGAQGTWRVTLKPLAASADPQTMTVTGKNTLTFENVLVGEVWLCSGQSNMAFTSKGSHNAEAEIAAANWPQIRLMKVAPNAAAEPVEAIEGTWAECTPQTMAPFSAVGYFFGRELHQQLNVPVGLICSAWGGTQAQAWTRRGALEANPALRKAYLQGTPSPKLPPQRQPSSLYNGMIAPLIPFAIRGAIWYQGEGNTATFDEAERYATLFPAMIQDWRTQWGAGDFPFLFVQLANFKARASQPDDTTWARLRETQLKTLALPATGMAVSIDIGDAKNIHPTNKQDVGRRLALAALHELDPGAGIVYSGPMLESMSVEGGRAILTMSHVGGGLVSHDTDGKAIPLQGFAIAGADRQFVWAEARIDGETIVVSSPQVSAPVAVRYGWGDNPAVSLYNQAGLPASPFRTDAWPPAAPVK